MNNPDIKIQDIKVLSDNWYKLNKVTYQMKISSGEWETHSRECYDRGNGAGIILYHPLKKTVILTKQFRMPTYVNGNESGMMIEVCAGLLDADQPEACAKKEAQEETGFVVEKVKKVFELYMSPGAVTEILYLFVGEYKEDQKKSAGGGIKGEEDIEVLEIPFTKAIQMMESGEIKDAKTVILLQYLQIHKMM